MLRSPKTQPPGSRLPTLRSSRLPTLRCQCGIPNSAFRIPSPAVGCLPFRVYLMPYYPLTLFLTLTFMRKRTIRLLQFMFVILFPLSVLAVEFSEFQTPPDSARPAVYWFIMDGNLTKEGITADFEAMKQQGIGGLILMEVNVGVPRGKVEFMSETWQEHFVHIVRETERLG
ncbi:MAG: hypothetical protein LBQ66_04575, partial [Planctomycetaceae bacterium]|nr:hypothetical protein [Planctomycetaceae bacterium]